MATRTAPTVGGTPSFKRASYKFIDFVGAEQSESIDLPAAATDAQIEAIAAAMQDSSNASLKVVEVTSVYYSSGDKGNAEEEVYQSLSDGLLALFKNTTNFSRSLRIPAIKNAAFIDTTVDLDPAFAPVSQFVTAVRTALGAGWESISVRMTERKKTNKRSKL